MARSYNKSSSANSVRSDAPGGDTPPGFKPMVTRMDRRTGGRFYSETAISADDAISKHPEINTLLNNDDATDALALAITNVLKEKAAEYANEYFELEPSERRRTQEINATVIVQTEGGKFFEVTLAGTEVEYSGGKADEYDYIPPDFDDPEDIYRPDIISYARVREVRLGTKDEFTTDSSQSGFTFGKVKSKR